MPRTRSLAWSELKLGVLTTVAVVIAAVTVFLVTGGQGFFWQRYTLKTRFPNVAGLKSGSPVRLAGIEIGSVTDTPLVGEQVDVIFEVNRSYRDRITTTSVSKLGSVSLLGEAAVDITPSSGGTPIPEGGYVPSGKAPAQLADVTDQASAGIAELSGLIHDVRAGRGTLGKIVTDDQLYVDLQQFVDTASDLTKNLRDGRGTLGKLLTDRKTADALEATVTNIERLTADLNAGQGSLGKLLKDQGFANSLSNVTANLKDVTDRLNRGEGTAGKLLADPALFNQLNSVASRLDVLLTRVSNGEGTAGLLLKDKQLYENINGVVTDLRNLVAAIQKDPSKYLNVRISVF
jgi:phospholipid/cholesterol/gamma-HCH transport system substrate-binding protein